MANYRATKNEDFWINVEELNSRSYTCGYCGEKICSDEGYYLTNDYCSAPTGMGYIYICHNCNKPTYFDFECQVPSSTYGKEFAKEIFPDENTYLLYNEIRNCYKANAFSSCVLSSRKLLMHIAVDCGADKGKSFAEYVTFLDENNYIPKNTKGWVDLIRTKGNEINHEIVIFKKKDAEQIINFIEIIINVVYEMKYQADKYINED